MARTTDQPSAAIRPKTARAQQGTDGSGSFDGPNQRGENGRLGDNAERRENLTAVRDEQDNERDDSRDNRDDFRGNHDERGNLNRHDERKPRDGKAEQGSRREQPSAHSAGLDAFAPVLEAWTQVFKSWSELTETMVKAQQDAFASMIGGANTTAKKINVDDRRNGGVAFSGSRTTAATPDRIEHDRR